MNLVLELADVTRPVKFLEQILRLGIEAVDRAAGLAREPVQKRPGQRQNVVPALAQRRQMHGDGADTVEQILPQLAVLDGFLGLAIGRGDDPAVNLVIVFAANTPGLAFLEHAQQLALRVDGHFGQLIQHQGAAFRLLEQPRLVRVRAGEGAFHVTEQFALDELARQRGTIDLDARTLGARAQAVDQIGDNFLAGPALAGDQDGHVGRRNPLDGAHDRFHPRTLENGGRTTAHAREGGPQRGGLGGERLVLQRLFDLDYERLRIKRFLDELIRTVLGRGDGRVDARVAGEDDDFGVRPLLLDEGQEVQTVTIRKLQVQEHDILLLAFEAGLEFRRGTGLSDFKPLDFENFTDDLPDFRGVIHRKQFGFHSN